MRLLDPRAPFPQTERPTAMHVESRGRGPDLVLVHGWAMHSGVFGTLTEELVSRYTLHLVDLPGHGRSADAEPELALQDVARRIVAVAPRATWLGWSLGGLVCLQAALAHPARVRGLALIATSPRFAPAEDWPHAVAADVFARFATDLQRDTRGTLERFLALECHGSDRARTELRALRAQVCAGRQPSAQTLAQGLRCLAQADFRELLPTLTMPSLWIAGERDKLVPAQAMAWAADVAPAARYACVAGASHAPFIGHPEAVLRELLPFLEAQGTA